MSPEALRYRCCGSKIAHSTFTEANYHARRLTRETGTKYHAYKCPFFDHFHAGRKSRRLHSYLARKSWRLGRRFSGKKNRFTHQAHRAA